MAVVGLVVGGDWLYGGQCPCLWVCLDSPDGNQDRNGVLVGHPLASASDGYQGALLRRRRLVSVAPRPNHRSAPPVAGVCDNRLCSPVVAQLRQRPRVSRCPLPRVVKVACRNTLCKLFNGGCGVHGVVSRLVVAGVAHR